MTWQAVGVERITPEAPADLSAFSSTLAPSFSWKRSRVAQQLAFVHWPYRPAQPECWRRCRHGQGRLLPHPRFPPLSFLQRGLAGGARHKEADNRGHSQQHRDHDPNLGGGGGQGNAAGNHGGAQNQGQHQKAGDRQMRWNEFMLQSTSLGSVFCRCGKPAGGIYSSDLT